MRQIIQTEINFQNVMIYVLVICISSKRALYEAHMPHGGHSFPRIGHQKLPSKNLVILEGKVYDENM